MILLWSQKKPLYLLHSTRRSEVRLSYRTTPLEVSETHDLCLPQRHLNKGDLISLYSIMHTLLAILMTRSPHTVQLIIDTSYDPHKCCPIRHNYSYQYELDCPCIDVIFPSALIRPFCVQNTLCCSTSSTTLSVHILTCMNNKTILKRVALNASFPVWNKGQAGLEVMYSR